MYFFSSELMFGRGENHGQAVENSWKAAVGTSGAEFLPTPDMQKKLIDYLKALSPVFVASGHSPVSR
jgi:hypothetical protein